MRNRLRPLAAALTGLLIASAVAPATADTVVVLGLHNDLPDTKKYRDWQDLRLGMSLRGRLIQMAANSGAFALLEEHALASSVSEAVGGYWLREPGALRDPGSLAQATGAGWILYGNLSHVGVTRQRASGLVGRVSWKYRVVLTVCLYGSPPGELCEEAEGTSKTSKVTAGFQYRGNDVAWDQAGPAEAVNQALAEAFAAVYRRASPHFGRRDRTSIDEDRPPLATGEPLPVYVASFGLSSLVAQAYPELAASQVGLGVCQRIVEALYDSGRFTFLEEKAEVVAQMARLLRGETAGGEAAAPAEAGWLLYGEVVDLQVARREKVSRGATELESRVTLQIRLLERSSGRFFPAIGTGSHVARLNEWRGDGSIAELDERSVGLATDAAVHQAARKLLGS